MSIDINPIININNPEPREFSRLVTGLYKKTYLRTEQLNETEFEVKFDHFRTGYQPNKQLNIDIIPGFAKFEDNTLRVYRIIEVDIRDCPFMFDYIKQFMPHVFDYIESEEKYKYGFHITEECGQYTGNIDRTLHEIQQKMNYVQNINSKYILLFVDIVRHFYMGEELTHPFEITKEAATMLSRLNARITFENICEHSDVFDDEYEIEKIKTHVRDSFRSHYKIALMGNSILFTQNFNQYAHLPEFRILDILVKCADEVNS